MSFQSALSGLNAASRNLDVIGHNIANANTVGMKSSRAEFADLIASAGGGGASSGIGVAVATVSQQFTQGNVNITGSNLDVAINGGGFFQVKMPDGSRAYTRDGEFKLDKVGNIITNSGANVMGYPTDKVTGKPTSVTAQPLQLPTSAPIGAQQTTEIAAEFNLDARAPLAAGAAAVAADPTTIPPTPAIKAIPPTPLTTYGTSITTYDSQGVGISASVYMRKIAPDQWEMFTDPTSDASATGSTLGTLTFGTDGLITGPIDPATGEKSVSINITSPNPAIGTFPVTIKIPDVTQYGGPFAVSNLTQDGYASGELVDMKIGNDGVISARYSNGQTQAAGQIALADFRNVQGLAPTGAGNWAETNSSGQPVQGSPGVGKFGALRAGALEESNVDLTAELVNMMTAQRAYQSNAQTIKTQDQVLSTLVNLR